MSANHKRLGKNISQRRQYMKHREQDLQKREQGLDRQAVPEGIARPLSSIALQHEAVRGTKDEPPIISSSTNLSEHLLSAAARSEEAADGRPFECCWCHHMIVANDNTEWKEHAFEDLLPYTCLKEVRSPESQAHSIIVSSDTELHRTALAPRLDSPGAKNGNIIWRHTTGIGYALLVAPLHSKPAGRLSNISTVATTWTSRC